MTEDSAEHLNDVELRLGIREEYEVAVQFPHNICKIGQFEFNLLNDYSPDKQIGSRFH